MPRFVVGSRNKKKLKEMLDLLGELGFDLADLTSYPDAPEVEETAETFVGNATLKATQLAPILKTWVIGEDSGLCVPALGGAPGVYSARYAGKHGADAANNAKLLREMAHLKGVERAAYYVSTAVLADPTGKVIADVEGRCHGIIIDAFCRRIGVLAPANEAQFHAAIAVPLAPPGNESLRVVPGKQARHVVAVHIESEAGDQIAGILSARQRHRLGEAVLAVVA